MKKWNKIAVCDNSDYSITWDTQNIAHSKSVAGNVATKERFFKLNEMLILTDSALYDQCDQLAENFAIFVLAKLIGYGMYTCIHTCLKNRFFLYTCKKKSQDGLDTG
jgi:hypothetical protein